MAGTKVHSLCILQLLSFWLLAAHGVFAQGPVNVPKTLTHELGTYYLSTLGADIQYYGILTGRNVLGTNAYNAVNGMADNTKPFDAAFQTSIVRGSHTSKGIEGKVTVDIFYKLFRCAAPPDCLSLERVVIASSADASGPQGLIAVVKGTIGNTGWLINANQSAVNALLSGPNTVEHQYRDPSYKADIFYKVTSQPTPCSSANPQTNLGPIGEFENLPQFGCIDYQGYTMLLATSTQTGYIAMREYGISPERCNGSLAVYYTTDITNQRGPSIVALMRRPDAVPVTLHMILPFDRNCVTVDYSDPEIVLQAAAFLSMEVPFNDGPGSATVLPTPQSIADLGFADACAPVFYAAYYGSFLTGNRNDIADAFPGNQTFMNQLVTYNKAEMCVSAIGYNSEDSRNSDEDACAQLYFGDAAQQREGMVTYFTLNTTAEPDPLLLDRFDAGCHNSYSVSIENILPQIASEFELEKNYLLGPSTNVRGRVEGVAANAASIVALEVGLASAGLIIARIVGGSSFNRRRLIPSSHARLLACAMTASVVSVLNAPNFALIRKSLHSARDKTVLYTMASVQQYKVGNYSGFLMSETHAFVTVEGSGATAIIGLILYLSTLLFSVYTTWGEFTEIISRMNEAESRLGYEAVAASKNLSVQWRETDSLLHDALHPKVDKETALAADVELTRPNRGEHKLKKPPGRDREFEGAWSAYTVLESPVPGPGAV